MVAPFLFRIDQMKLFQYQVINNYLVEYHTLNLIL
jgi:hypothetical protein